MKKKKKCLPPPKWVDIQNLEPLTVVKVNKKIDLKSGKYTSKTGGTNKTRDLHFSNIGL